MKLLNKVTLEQVKESKSDTVYYSSRTFWWTDDPQDLQKSKPLPAHLVPKGMDPATYGTSIPCDIFGAPLFQIEKEKWIGDIGKIEAHYGGVPVLMAMHHKNFTPDIGDSIRSFSVKQTFIDAIAKQHAELVKNAKGVTMADEMRAISEQSGNDTHLDEEGYNKVISLIKEAAHKGMGSIKLPGSDLSGKTTQRLITDGFSVAIEKRLNGNAIVSWSKDSAEKHS